MKKHPREFSQRNVLAALFLAAFALVVPTQAATSLVSGGDISAAGGWSNGMPTSDGANDGVVSVSDGVWGCTLNNANVGIAGGGKVVASATTALAFSATGSLATLLVQNNGVLDLQTGRTSGTLLIGSTGTTDTARLVVDAGGLASIQAIRFRSETSSIVNGTLNLGTDSRILTTGTFLTIGSTGSVSIQQLATGTGQGWDANEIVDFTGVGGSLTLSNVGNLNYYQNQWDNGWLTYNGQNKAALGGADFSNYFSVNNTILTSIPEPGSLALLGSAGAFFVFKRRRRV